MKKGELYNLTSFCMCAHNGTHIDAPCHFIKDGKAVNESPLESFAGTAYVAEHRGIVTEDDAVKIIEKAKMQNEESAKRILIKGDAEVSLAVTRGQLQIFNFWEMNRRRSNRRMHQWQCILRCCPPRLFCLREFVWKRFRKAFIF